MTDLPRRLRCEMLVAGGGSASLAAAVAAARTGAQTLLVEWSCTLGVMATAALVHSVCGLCLLREEPGAVPTPPASQPRRWCAAPE